jgi:hypothetical protein
MCNAGFHADHKSRLAAFVDKGDTVRQFAAFPNSLLAGRLKSMLLLSPGWGMLEVSVFLALILLVAHSRFVQSRLAFTAISYIAIESRNMPQPPSA